MDIYPKNKLPIAEVKKFIIVFFSVGVLGFILPFTRDFFIIITPLALLLNTYLLAVYHKYHGLKELFVFLFIFSVGYILEVIGVNYGLIFGEYTYGSALGIKCFNTPLMIGVNWLFLTYSASAITDSLKLKKSIAIILAPLFMLIYDLVLEQVAPKMDMWHWHNEKVPLQNYIAWYIISLGFIMLIKAFNVKTPNPLGPTLFISQLLFFIILIFLL